jgi:hypothetical protein
MGTTLTRVLVSLTFVLAIFAAPTNTPAEARPRSAGPDSAVSVTIPATVTEAAKVILGQTSVAAPGFAGNASQGVSTAISWAGTDSLHRINVLTSTSSDGLHYGNKRILNQETVDRPALAREPGRGGGAVAIAWRGTDSQHRVNVLYDPYGVHGPPRQAITSQTTFTTPAIAFFQAHLLLAWTGTDPAHHLNVLPIGIMGPGLTPGAKTVLGFTANTGPSLAVDIAASGAQTAVLSWATTASRIDLAQSTDGVHFTSALGAGLAATTASSPVFVHFTSGGGPEYWIAWTGTDAAHHLNVKWTSAAAYPQWTGAKTILPELALGGPGLGFQQGLLIAWTGTDAAHHLNVARLQGS